MWKVFSQSDRTWQCDRAIVSEWYALSSGIKENVYKLYDDVLWYCNEKRRF